MATFPKGSSFKQQDVYIASAFPQKGTLKNGEPMTGYNVSLGVANDRRDPENVITNPMLAYKHYQDAQGQDKVSFTQSYSKAQYEAMMEAANKDGDYPVLTGDLMPSKSGGLVVNTTTLATPETPFDAAAHKENTEAARKARDAKRALEQEAEKSAEIVDEGADLEA